MATDKATDKTVPGKTVPPPPPPRRVWSPTPVAALLPAILRPALRRRAPGVAQLLAEWPAIVGPALAAVTTPRRLAGGTLTLGCATTVAMELHYSSGSVIQRINGHAGRVLVERLRFVPDAEVPPPAPKAPPRPTPAAIARVAETVAGIEDGPLREALTRLGQAVAARAGPAREAEISRDSDRHA